MLNPGTYVTANPTVRKQYLKSASLAVAAWKTLFRRLAGMFMPEDVEVNNDPRRADFRKIKVGNTRLDPGGGLQQFMVALGTLCIRTDCEYKRGYVR